MARIEFDRVSKIFPGGVKAVDSATLVVEDGELVVLVGPSGCGKSTLLRMVAGLEEINTGRILLDGRVVNDVSPGERDVAMVFQNYALYPHMTVAENLAFPLKMRKVPKVEREGRVREVAESLGLSALLERRPRDLSGGQQQRVAVGRAIVRRPRAFLFDEPLSNLDAKLRGEMRVELKRLHGRLEATMIYVTHDQVEAMTLGDRIVVMSGGLVQQVGTPGEVYDHPVNRFVAGFLGSPPTNFLKGRIASEGGRLLFTGGGGVRVFVPERKREALDRWLGREMACGLRPEDLLHAVEKGGDGGGGEVDLLIDVIEPLGNEQVVYGTTGAGTVIARIDPHVPIRAGERIRLQVREDRAHFFDLHNGINVEP